MKPYICNDPIKHDGEYLAVGDSLELDDKQAGPLLKAGVIHLDTDALLVEKLAAGSDADNIKPEKVRKPKDSDRKPAADEQDANHADAGNESADTNEGGA